MDTADYRQPLTENFFFIQGPERGRFPHCNSFLVDGNPRVLIDAGAGEALIRELDRERRIDVLVITHSHPDHILAAHSLRDRHLMLPRETPESVHDLFELGRRFTGTDRGGEYWKSRMTEVYGLKPLKQPDSRYSQGDILEFGSLRLEALHAPGHLLDHYGFYEHQSRVLLTTDIDFTGFGPWYGHAEADPDQFLADVDRFRNLGAGASCVCSSHVAPLHSGILNAFDDYLSVFHTRENEILEACRGGVCVEEIVAMSPFYRNRFPDRFLQTVYETIMVEKTLDRLARLGTLCPGDRIDSWQTEDATHADH